MSKCCQLSARAEISASADRAADFGTTPDAGTAATFGLSFGNGPQNHMYALITAVATKPFPVGTVFFSETVPSVSFATELEAVWVGCAISNRSSVIIDREQIIIDANHILRTSIRSALIHLKPWSIFYPSLSAQSEGVINEFRVKNL
jgi:hypothetical protein